MQVSIHDYMLIQTIVKTFMGFHWPSNQNSPKSSYWKPTLGSAPSIMIGTFRKYGAGSRGLKDIVIMRYFPGESVPCFGDMFHAEHSQSIRNWTFAVTCDSFEILICLLWFFLSSILIIPKSMMSLESSTIGLGHSPMHSISMNLSISPSASDIVNTWRRLFCSDPVSGFQLSIADWLLMGSQWESENLMRIWKRAWDETGSISEKKFIRWMSIDFSFEILIGWKFRNLITLLFVQIKTSFYIWNIVKNYFFCL